MQAHPHLLQMFEQAKRKLMREAIEARTDPAKFFSFVMKEEHTRQRIECVPHQRLLFKFVEHFDRSVIRMPVGFSKTYCLSAYGLYRLGKRNTDRGAIVSAGRGQAEKPLANVKSYVGEKGKAGYTYSAELRLVFPHLQPTRRESEAWTQSKMVVDRPPGIRDPSLTAVGYRGKLPGARLNWILGDDLLTDENTKTKEQIDGVNNWVMSTVLSRRDIQETKVCFTNTPWAPNDVTFWLEAAGWPSMTMDIDGNIYFKNTCETDLVEGAKLPYEGEFDCDDIRPSKLSFPEDQEFVSDTKDMAYRLTAHDDPKYDPNLQHLSEEERYQHHPNGWVDEYDAVPLWPEKFSRDVIERLEEEYAATPHEYNRLFKCKVRSEEDARVKIAWINDCKTAARERQINSYVSKWDPKHGRAFTGVDLGFGQKKKSALTVIFTFAVLPEYYRRILRIDAGRFDGATTLTLLEEHHKMFDTHISVETNAAQKLLKQWARERNKSLPVRAHFTGINKNSRMHGVESIFYEIENGSWLIPNDPQGSVPKEVQAWIDGMLYYDPTKHTPDHLIACWIAREHARKAGALRRGAKDGPRKAAARSMAR